MTMVNSEELIAGVASVHTFKMNIYDGNKVTETDTLDMSRKQRYEKFTVIPSPCNNIGNHVDPVPYSFNRTVRVLPFGTLTYEGWQAGRLTYRSVVSGCHSGDRWGSSTILGNYVLPEPTTDAATKALAKFYDAIRDSEISLNTSVGEARESLEMISSMMRSAAKIRKGLRKLKKDLRLNPLQTVGGLWLGWAVGLKPLLNDVENIRRHALKDLSPDLMFRVKARASQQVTRVNSREAITVDDRVEYGATIRIDNVHKYETWRAGLTTRPTLLWELTTLSFVVDYFINVGQYLEIWEASVFDNGFSLVGGYKTVTTKVSRRRSFSGKLTPTAPVDLVYADLHMSEETTRKDRTLLSRLPMARAPIVKIPRGSEQLLTVASLLSGLISRR